MTDEEFYKTKEGKELQKDNAILLIIVGLFMVGMLGIFICAILFPISPE